MRTRFVFYLGLWLVAMLALLAPARALAHGGHRPANIQTFTQAVGPYELAVTLELPLSVPSPLYLTIAPQGDVAGATMQFRAVPRGIVPGRSCRAGAGAAWTTGRVLQ